MRAFVCQDKYGFWFTTLEDEGWGLYVIAHAGTRQHAEDEAWQHADQVIVQSPPYLDFPPGGIAPSGMPDGYMPEPRRCQ